MQGYGYYGDGYYGDGYYGGTEANKAAAARSPWIRAVKAYQAQHGVSYKEALMALSTGKSAKRKGPNTRKGCLRPAYWRCAHWDHGGKGKVCLQPACYYQGVDVGAPFGRMAPMRVVPESKALRIPTSSIQPSSISSMSMHTMEKRGRPTKKRRAFLEHLESQNPFGFGYM